MASSDWCLLFMNKEHFSRKRLLKTVGFFSELYVWKKKQDSVKKLFYWIGLEPGDRTCNCRAYISSLIQDLTRSSHTLHMISMLARVRGLAIAHSITTKLWPKKCYRNTCTIRTVFFLFHINDKNVAHINFTLMNCKIEASLDKVVFC